MKNLFLAGMVLLLCSCSGPSPQKIADDKTLFELGKKMYDKKRYSDANPYFEELKNRFPESPFAIESELKLAQGQFETGEYASAQIEYESFRSLHPTHEKIPHVYLQIGKCQLLQAPSSVQKDQTETEQAARTLNDVVTRWPDSKEASEAQTFLNQANEKLIKKQLYLANFYIGQKKYFPALKRLESLNNETTPQPLRREALFKLGYVHYKMKNTDIAKLAFEKLVNENVSDAYQNKAKHYLDKLQSKN